MNTLGLLSLIPPFLVLLLAFISKKVILALIVGIMSAALIATSGSIPSSISIILTYAMEQFEPSNLYTFSFLIMLGSLIALVTEMGGTQAYSHHIKKWIHTSRDAESVSIFLSFFFVIDDFFSSLTVGSIMRPVTDQFGIPRAKLAFLIDAMAAPLVLLTPFSSWIPMLTKQLEKAGVTNRIANNPLIYADPFGTYIRCIPFLLYSFVIFAAVLFIVRRKISFGLMHQHEQIAKNSANLFGGKTPRAQNISQYTTGTSSLWDFVIPLGSFVTIIMFLLIYTGGFWLIGGHNSLFTAIIQADLLYSLFLGSMISLSISLIYFIAHKKLLISAVPTILYQGFQLMGQSIIVLLLAWTFSEILTHQLNTGQYLAHILLKALPSFLLPAMFFFVAAITSISTGSSWGTIAVMIPLAIPMLTTLATGTPPFDPVSIPLLLPTIGAIFSGAVAGDHISPISSTTLMSSTSAGAYHADHVDTQFQYALPGIVGCIVGFIIAGFLANESYQIWLSASSAAISGTTITLLLLMTMNKK